MRIIMTYMATVLLSTACGEKTQPELFQGAARTANTDAVAESSPSGAVAADHSEPLVAKTGVQPATSAATPLTPVPTVEPMEEDGDTISEPVSIGGAFLTCAHDSQQLQNKSIDWVLTCRMADVDFKRAKVNASFMKVDAKGGLLPLKILAQTSNVFGVSWTLSDGPNTMFINKLEASFSIEGSTPLNFATSVEKPISVALSPNYWLVNEPNDKDGKEDCVEFVNEAERVKHADFNKLPQPLLGRFNDQDCAQSKRFLCRSVDSSNANKWMISPSPESYDEYALACPSGYKFSLPMNDAEIAEVAALVDSNTNPYMVWVAMNDLLIEKNFTIVIK